MISEIPIQSSTNRRLSSDRIITRILESSKTPKFRFEILNDVVVSRATLTRYISYLLGEGMLVEVRDKRKTLLRTTSKGIEFLKRKKGVQILYEISSHDDNNGERKEEEAERAPEVATE